MTVVFAAARRGVRRIDRRWNDLPLRNRLTTAAALAATLAIVSVVAVSYIAVRHELRAQIDNNLRKQAGEIRLPVQRDLMTGDYTVSPPSGVGEINGYVQVLDAQGHVAPGGEDRATLPVTAADLRIASEGGTKLRDAQVGGLHVRILTAGQSRLPGVAVQVAVPLTDVDHQLGRLAAAFGLLAIGGLVLTVILSWAAVRRVTRPVRTLTEAAEQIAETRDLTVRIEAMGDDELGRLASTFNVMLDELQRSVGAQRQLVMDASHELRTPLASLRTNVEVLHDVDRLSAEQRQAVLSGIVTQLDELTGLVADVVELARGESLPGEAEDVALDELVSNAVERAERHWPALTFRLRTEPTQVRGVPVRLDRAVANLLDNAGKFSPAGSEVAVTLTGDGTLTVADSGPGVPAAALPFVFDRFFRADEARAMPGSGLGLAIAQQVAEGHGGRVSLSNRSGGGAIATLALPTVDAAAAPDESPDVMAAEPALPF